MCLPWLLIPWSNWAYHSTGVFPDNVAGVRSAAASCPLCRCPPAGRPLVRRLQGGGQLAEDIEQREERQDHAQQEGMEVAASHLALLNALWI